MKVLKIYKMLVESSPIVPIAVSHTREHLVVAEDEQDARDSFDVTVTGVFGSKHKVVSCECIGNVSHIVTDKMKESWRDDCN